MSKLSERAREKAACKKAKYASILSIEDRRKLKKRAQNTPYLDRMIRCFQK